MVDQSLLLLFFLTVATPFCTNGFLIGPATITSSTSSTLAQSSIRHSRPTTTTTSLDAVRNKGPLEADPDEGMVEKRVVGEIKQIDRTWTWTDDNGEEFIPDGEIEMDVFYPEGSSSKPKGAVFFMHGFSQYPVAYEKTLRAMATNANVVVFAVETGITSSVARGPICSDQQFWLQRAVSQDTIQLIQMMKAGELSPAIDSEVPIGLCGHSMGGGLCFYVAAQFPQVIDYVFTMAPAYGVKEFDPIAATKKAVAANSMCLAGTWDFIARASKVKEIVVNSNEQVPDSSIYGLIDRGLHGV